MVVEELRNEIVFVMEHVLFLYFLEHGSCRFCVNHPVSKGCSRNIEKRENPSRPLTPRTKDVPAVNVLVRTHIPGLSARPNQELDLFLG